MALYRSVYYYLLLLLLFLSTSYELSVWIDDAGWLVNIYEWSDVSESVCLSHQSTAAAGLLLSGCQSMSAVVAARALAADIGR